MKRFRARCLVLAFGLGGCTRARAPHESPPEGPPDLAIIYGADLRGAVATPSTGPGGLARRATLVDRARLSAGAVAQVDAGDFVPAADDGPGLGEAGAREARARLVLQAYHRMGLDAVTLGERDLALGLPALRALGAETKVPIVAANLVDGDGRPPFPGDIVVQTGTLDLGVFGILDLGTERTPDGVTLTDPTAAARAAVRSLRAHGARLVVGLFHVAGGLTRAREIAEAAGGVDVIVLGHEGPAAAPRFVWSGPGGARLGRIDVRTAGRREPRLDDQLVDVAPGIPEQVGVHLLVRVAAGPIPATFNDSIAAIQKATGRRPYGENWTYGSTPLCVACHVQQAAQWKKTDHAQALATLEPSGKQRDPACIGCHATGFLLAGGAQNLETGTTHFKDVGCETCHGPSQAHVVQTDKRKGTSRKVDPVLCLGCHTPDQNRGPFVLADAMKQIIGPGHGAPVVPPPP